MNRTILVVLVITSMFASVAYGERDAVRFKVVDQYSEYPRTTHLDMAEDHSGISATGFNTVDDVKTFHLYYNGCDKNLKTVVGTFIEYEGEYGEVLARVEFAQPQEVKIEGDGSPGPYPFYHASVVYVNGWFHMWYTQLACTELDLDEEYVFYTKSGNSYEFPEGTRIEMTGGYTQYKGYTDCEDASIPALAWTPGFAAVGYDASGSEPFFYCLHGSNASNHALGAAKSTDGINWTHIGNGDNIIPPVGDYCPSDGWMMQAGTFVEDLCLGQRAFIGSFETHILDCQSMTEYGSGLGMAVCYDSFGGDWKWVSHPRSCMPDLPSEPEVALIGGSGASGGYGIYGLSNSDLRIAGGGYGMSGAVLPFPVEDGSGFWLLYSAVWRHPYGIGWGCTGWYYKRSVELAKVYATQNAADVNFDGMVDFWDLSGFSAAYGKSSGETGYQETLDFDNDGMINFWDLSGFSARYGTDCTYSDGVDLKLEGLESQYEESPGGVVVVNDDDDNDNGIVDKDETTAQEREGGEDDLVRLTISPPLRQDLITGNTTLDWDLDESYIRVYAGTAADPRATRIFPADSESAEKAIWATSNLPVDLYIEGVDPTVTTGEVVFTAKKDGVQQDVIKIAVMQLQWLNSEGDPVPCALLTSEETQESFERLPGNPGGVGGFGGPPDTTGFSYFVDAFRIENLTFGTDDDGLETISCDMISNVSSTPTNGLDDTNEFLLTELIAGSNVFTTINDVFRMTLYAAPAGDPGERKTFTAQVDNQIFGVSKSMKFWETGVGTDTYETRRLQIVATLTQLPTTAAKETMTAELISNIPISSTTTTGQQTLTETAANSLIFQNGTLEVAITRITNRTGTGEINDFSAIVTADVLAVDDEPIDAIENTSGSLQFRTDALQNSGEAILTGTCSALYNNPYTVKMKGAGNDEQTLVAELKIMDATNQEKYKCESGIRFSKIGQFIYQLELQAGGSYYSSFVFQRSDQRGLGSTLDGGHLGIRCQTGDTVIVKMRCAEDVWREVEILLTEDWQVYIEDPTNFFNRVPNDYGFTKTLHNTERVGMISTKNVLLVSVPDDDTVTVKVGWEVGQSLGGVYYGELVPTLRWWQTVDGFSDEEASFKIMTLFKDDPLFNRELRGNSFELHEGYNDIILKYEYDYGYTQAVEDHINGVSCRAEVIRVDRAAWNDAKDYISAAFASSIDHLPQHQFAQTLLHYFYDGTLVSWGTACSNANAGSPLTVDDTITIQKDDKWYKALTHKAGVDWDEDGSTVVSKLIWNDNTLPSMRIERSGIFKDFVLAQLKQNYDTLKGAEDEAESKVVQIVVKNKDGDPDNASVAFTATKTDIVLNPEKSDLAFALGSVNVTGKLIVTVQPKTADGSVTVSVAVDATIHDLYDFDYTSDNWYLPIKSLAMLEVGWATFDSSHNDIENGSVFLTEVMMEFSYLNNDDTPMLFTIDNPQSGE